MEHAVMCPQCGAPLAPHRFARSIVCSHCGATIRLDESSVSAARFHETLRVWNSPESYGIPTWISIGERHWALDQRLAQGEISDVYAGRRARWPTELVILKILRDRRDIELSENEWEVVQRLQQSQAPGADTFTRLLPQPVLHGDITGGSFVGQRASLFRRFVGFRHTFAQVIKVYPQGIPPRASVWIWRRILEVLSFIHASGMAHGAVLPEHLLIQDHDHGVRLVGYSRAGPLGAAWHTLPPGSESFCPQPTSAWSALTPSLDLAMSARNVIALLGGDPASGSVPAAVPAPLASLVKRVALSAPDALASTDAWSLREELGQLSDDVFGAPQFIPISMPN